MLELYMKAERITNLNFVTNILLNHRAIEGILMLFMVNRNRKVLYKQAKRNILNFEKKLHDYFAIFSNVKSRS